MKFFNYCTPGPAWVKILLLLWLLPLGCQQNKQPEKPAADGRVVGIKDGDTIEVMEQGKAVTVRLAEVDAPEKNQDFGTQARKFTSDLAYGKEVRLLRHDTDRYGRIVANVVLPDGRSLNEELVKEGFAWHYKDYSKSTRLANLEADARTYRRGLWAQPNPVAPWEFRKNKRAKSQQASQPKTNNAAADEEAARKISGNTPVWVCSSKTVKFFHVQQTCSRLQRCGKEIVALTKAQAVAQGKGRLCSVCG